METEKTALVQNLNDIRVASPCAANWAEMSGDDRSRHCALCKKNVYNLSAMTQEQALALIREKEGKLCVRFYRRADGTVLTENCPVGLVAVRRRMRWLAAGAAALLAMAVSVGLGVRRANAAGSGGGLRSMEPFQSLQNVEPVRSFLNWVSPRQMVLGEICIKSPTVLPPPPKQPAAPQQ